MRLTLVNQFYPPDLAPTGHLAASLANHRATLNDQVTVLTSQGGYVSSHRPAKSKSTDNSRVIRLWTPRLGRSSMAARLVDYAVFFALTTLRVMMLPRQDVIVSLTTPPYIVLAALAHKLLHPSTQVILWMMDCYPEVLERDRRIGVGGILSRVMRRLNRYIFSRLAALICLDGAMQALLHESYGESLPTTIIANWEPEAEYPVDAEPGGLQISGDLRLGDQFIVLYLGNAGLGHQFETVIEAARALQDDPVAFVFVGGGEKWTWLQQAMLSANLRNLHLFGYVEKERTPSILAAADCSLITLRDEYLGVISPSKLHAGLAMGLPVLYLGPPGGNVDTAIQQHGVGVSLRHGDVDGVVGFIREMMTDQSFSRELRRRARQAFLLDYSDSRALRQFDTLFTSLGGDRSEARRA